MSIERVRLRVKIADKFLETAKKHIDNGDLKAYWSDDTYIYKYISQHEYQEMLIKAQPLMMDELGVQAEFDENYPDE